MRILDFAEAFKELHGRRGDLVPLDVIRDALHDVPSKDLERALFLGERNQIWSLKISNDPLAPGVREDGIHVPGRGWIFYVLLR